jgi:hypothetical protein
MSTSVPNWVTTSGTAVETTGGPAARYLSVFVVPVDRSAASSENGTSATSTPAINSGRSA